jgi:hypothetical protein
MTYKTSIDGLADGEEKTALIIARLSVLLGTWKGEGNGRFPTIAPFNYTEECVFTGFEDILLLKLESIMLGNDPRLVKTMRKYELQRNMLSYLIEMATVRTPNKKI